MTAIPQLVRRPRPSSSEKPRGDRALRFVTFLAPNLFDFYAFIADHVARTLDCPTEIAVGSRYDELAAADVAFVCSLPYVELMCRGQNWVEPIAAPILQGDRYQGKPVYFSDVIVHRDSPFRSFADLRGRSWAFNEPQSQSGYGITRYHLANLGETNGYFSDVIQAGWHERAMRMVCDGQIDASAIDSHVLAVMLRDEPALASRIRIIDSLGPSTIQPVVVARRLSADVKSGVRDAILGLAKDPAARSHFDRALVENFIAADDSDYDDVRAMRDVAAAADFLTLR